MKRTIALAVALVGAAALGALAVAYSAAAPGDAPARPAPAPTKATTAEFSVRQETAIREIVRQYLVQHPEVLVDAARAYDERQSALQAAATKDGARKNLAALISADDSAAAGKDVAHAKVAVIEFFDYHCGFCKHAAPAVKKLTVSDPAVKVVFRDFPVIREESEFAAEAALASRAQGKYAGFHFALMNATGVLTHDRVLDIAKKSGLDTARLEADAKSPAVQKALDETHKIARELHVDGTPAFIIATLDGSYVDVIPGFRDDRDILASIDKAKKAAG